MRIYRYSKHENNTVMVTKEYDAAPFLANEDAAPFLTNEDAPPLLTH